MTQYQRLDQSTLTIVNPVGYENCQSCGVLLSEDNRKLQLRPDGAYRIRPDCRKCDNAHKRELEKKKRKQEKAKKPPMMDGSFQAFLCRAWV